MDEHAHDICARHDSIFSVDLMDEVLLDFSAMASAELKLTCCQKYAKVEGSSVI